MVGHINIVGVGRRREETKRDLPKGKRNPSGEEQYQQRLQLYLRAGSRQDL
jgi:hypothetical protein